MRKFYLLDDNVCHFVQESHTGDSYFPTFLPSTAVTCSQKQEYMWEDWEDSKTGRPKKGSDIQWKKDDDNDHTKVNDSWGILFL